MNKRLKSFDLKSVMNQKCNKVLDSYLEYRGSEENLYSALSYLKFKHNTQKFIFRYSHCLKWNIEDGILIFYENFLSDLKNAIQNTTRYVIIPLHVTLCSKSKKYHSNGLIFDKQKKTLYRIEPFGDNFDFDGHRDIINNDFLEFISFLHENSVTSEIWKYQKPVDVGPQLKQSNNNEYRNGEAKGFCQAWMLLIVHVRLNYPNLSHDEIMKVFEKNNINEYKNIIVKYCVFLIQLLKKNDFLYRRHTNKLC